MSREFQGIWIPAHIWLADLTAEEKLLWAEIASFCRSGHCYATNEHFEKLCGCSKATIKRSIASLIKKGLIVAKYEPNKDGTIRTLTQAAAQFDPPRGSKPPKAAAQFDPLIDTEEINTELYPSEETKGGLKKMLRLFGDTPEGD